MCFIPIVKFILWVYSFHLFDNYGFKEVIEMIQALPELKKRVAYMPSINSPCELRDKWQKIIDAGYRMKTSSKNDIQENLNNVIW